MSHEEDVVRTDAQNKIQKFIFDFTTDYKNVEITTDIVETELIDWRVKMLQGNQAIKNVSWDILQDIETDDDYIKVRIVVLLEDGIVSVSETAKFEIIKTEPEDI